MARHILYEDSGAHGRWLQQDSPGRNVALPVIITLLCAIAITCHVVLYLLYKRWGDSATYPRFVLRGVSGPDAVALLQPSPQRRLLLRGMQMYFAETDGYADLIGYLETDPTAKDSSSPDVVTALPWRSGEEHPAVQDLGETSAAAAARAEQPAGSSPPASGSNSLRQLQQGTGSVDIVLELYDVPRKSRKTYKELLAAAAASPELLHKAIEKAAAATAAGFGSDGPAMVDITFRAVEHLPRASKENKQLQLTPGWSQMVFQPEAPQQPGGGPLYVQHSSDSGTAKAPGRPGSSVLVARALGDRPQPHSRAGSRHSSPPISRANSFTYVPVLIEPVRISGPRSIATADSSATGRGSSSGEPLQVIVDAAPPGAFIPPAAAADKDSAPGSAASLGLPAQRFTRSPSPRGASPLSGQTGSDGGAAAKARERAVPRERTTGP